MKPSPRAALAASKRAETRYVRDLRGILRRVHEAVGHLAAPHLVVARGDRRSDARPKGPDLGDRFMTALFSYTRRETAVAFDRMSAAVDKKNKAGLKLLGITPQSMGLVAVVEGAKDANIKLVENAARVYAQDVRDIFTDPANDGLRVEELAALLVERGNVSESRAALIARDQTGKLSAAINEHRQTSAGVSSFTWSTSRDERVRPSHAELDGERFDWDDLPIVDDEEAAPGQPVMCRCIATPIVDEIEEDAGEADYAEAAE